jgi:hypothetical protein
LRAEGEAIQRGFVIAGHSRPKDGVASLAYAGNPSFFARRWIRGSSPRMTIANAIVNSSGSD